MAADYARRIVANHYQWGQMSFDGALTLLALGADCEVVFRDIYVPAYLEALRIDREANY